MTPTEQSHLNSETPPPYLPSTLPAAHYPLEKQSSLEQPSPPRYSPTDLETATKALEGQRARRCRVWACAAVWIVLCAMVVGVVVGVVAGMRDEQFAKGA